MTHVRRVGVGLRAFLEPVAVAIVGCLILFIILEVAARFDLLVAALAVLGVGTVVFFAWLIGDPALE